jgi:VIT1/CCC1 family predicted Fe2+/Mn2+ transporter
MRKTISAILLVLAALLSIPAVALVWVQRDVVDVNRYAGISNAMLAQPEVQSQISTRVTDAIMEKVEVGSQIQSATADLPPRLASLLSGIAPALDSAIAEYVQRAASAVLASPKFASVWNKVNRAAHQSVIKVLRGEGDTVTVDLGPVVEEVKGRLVAQGFERAASIPELHPTYTVATSPKIAKARNVYDAFNVLRILIPILAALCLLGGVLLARDRWRTLMWGAIGVALAMGFMGLATWIVRDRIATGEVIYDAFVVSLRSAVRWVLLLSIVVAAGAYLVSYVRRRNVTPTPES